MKLVKKVTDIKDGDYLKIEAIADKNSYEKVGPVKVLSMKSSTGREWVEILINKDKNYYFNLSALLGHEKVFGKWVNRVWVVTR